MFGATCLVFLLLSCGGGGGDSETGSPSGSGQIMLTLQIDESQTETFGLKQTGAEFDCVGNHIDTIEILVLDASGNVIAEGGPFNCVDGTATLSAVAAGRDYTVQVNALDQEGFTIFSGEVTGVTVLANRVNTVGPVILLQVMNRKPRIMPPIGDKTVLEGEPLVFTVTAEDPDAAHTLAYSASDLPPGAIFDPVAQEFSWTPGFLDAGVYQVMFRVVDDGDPPMSDAETVNIIVGDVNRPPAMDPASKLWDQRGGAAGNYRDRDGSGQRPLDLQYRKPAAGRRVRPPGPEILMAAGLSGCGQLYGAVQRCGRRLTAIKRFPGDYHHRRGCQ